MEKPALIEYLHAVCDAENAVYACDEAINAIKQQKAEYKRLTPPSEPKIIIADTVKSSGKSGSVERFFEIVFVHVFRLVFFFVLYAFLLTVLKNIDSMIPLIAAAILTFTAGTYLGYFLPDFFFEKPRVNKINKQRIASADERNRQAKEEYTNKKNIYDQVVIVENSILDELSKAITEKKQLKTALINQLQQLYEMNIIYPAFRNIVAVNQIREYLEMGVCNNLEGPDGAYAQYLQDVRTNRICDSIKDLKDNLMLALNTLAMTQATLIHELRQTNSNIQQMNLSLKLGLSDMQRSLQAAQNATAGQFEDYIREANSSLEQIKQSTSSAAYNQYIALRQSNVRNYLLKAPY